MKRSIVALGASACLVALLGATAPAHAATLITFVSGGGSDGSDCLSPQTACRQISFALTQTDPTGTVHVLHGEYDPFIVDKSVDIIAELGTATIGNHTAVGVPGGGSTSILVQGDVIVRIRGFHIYNPAGGIVSIDAEVLHVEDCVITPGGNASGIDFRVTSSNTRELNVLDTVVTGDGSVAGAGVIIKPIGAASAKVLLDKVSVADNVGGILIDGRSTTGTNNVTIRNSTVSGTGSWGIFALDGAGGSTNVMVDGSTVANSGTFGVGANGTNTIVRMRSSTVTGNATGLLANGGGQVISLGGNSVAGNTANGAFSSTQPLQ